MAQRERIDFFVIGAGSGGVRAARLAAQRGKRVVVAEADRIGGTCVIRGCVPKKLLMQASHYREEFDDAQGFGWNLEVGGIDWPGLIAAKDREISRLSDIYRKNLAASGARLIEGRARLEGDGVVSVATPQGDLEFEAESILIASGSAPAMPAIPGRESAIGSNEAFDLPSLPSSVVIVGGGYIAVEFAGIFNGMGSRVVLSYRRDRLLRGFDADLGRRLGEQMAAKGIDIRFDSVIERLEKTADGQIRCHFADGSHHDAACVFYATGRRPAIADLGLQKAGVRLTESGAVAVDAFSRSSVAGVYAIGDVTDRLALTPVAIAEAVHLDRTLFDGRPSAMDYDHVAKAVFSQPQIASVGLSESDAVARHRDVEVYESAFKPLKASLSGAPGEMFMKLVIDARSQRVVGCHLLGADVSEMIQCLAVAVNMKATKADFDAAVAVHPTAAEELVSMAARRPGRP